MPYQNCEQYNARFYALDFIDHSSDLALILSFKMVSNKRRDHCLFVALRGYDGVNECL